MFMVGDCVRVLGFSERGRVEVVDGPNILVSRPCVEEEGEQREHWHHESHLEKERMEMSVKHHLGDVVKYGGGQTNLKGLIGTIKSLNLSREGMYLVAWDNGTDSDHHGSFLFGYREPIQRLSRVRVTVGDYAGKFGSVTAVNGSGNSFNVALDDGQTWGFARNQLRLTDKMKPETVTAAQMLDSPHPVGEMMKDDNAKPCRPELIPAPAIVALGALYARGAKKYSAENWRKGSRWSRSVGALERHLKDWQMGIDYDPETGAHQLIAVAWNAITLFMFQITGVGVDDRADKGVDREKIYVRKD